MVPIGGSTDRTRPSMMTGMKRYGAAALWLYAAWYAGSAISMFMGAPDVLGPALGLSAGLIVGLDPRHLIWNRSRRITASAA